VASMLDARAAGQRWRLVCVGGNSLGWYTALAAAGALSFEDGFRLVQEMALLQEQGTPGGQVIWPLVDESWQADPAARARLAAVLAAHPDRLFPSIRLGGYAVLAGTPEGVSAALAELPRVRLGTTTYPFRLAQHGPYHTHLASAVAVQARQQLARLEFRAPAITLIDGRGRRHTPWSADVEALRDYTLGAQVDTPYDFSASVRVALCEYAPERLVLPGPGNSLGGVCAQVAIALGWRGLSSRATFEALQASERPLLESLRR